MEKILVFGALQWHMAQRAVIGVHHDGQAIMYWRWVCFTSFSHKTFMRDLEFIKLNASHAKAMWCLETACFSLPWSLSQCAAALRQPNFAACGFMDAGLLVAYLSFYHAADEMEILNLAVLSDWRRKGLARQLLGIVLQASLKMGIQKASLEVRETNFAAISLYEQCGFRRSGVRPHYYPDTGENGLIYMRENPGCNHPNF